MRMEKSTLLAYHSKKPVNAQAGGLYLISVRKRVFQTLREDLRHAIGLH